MCWRHLFVLYLTQQDDKSKDKLNYLFALKRQGVYCICNSEANSEPFWRPKRSAASFPRGKAIGPCSYISPPLQCRRIWTVHPLPYITIPGVVLKQLSTQQHVRLYTKWLKQRFIIVPRNQPKPARISRPSSNRPFFFFKVIIVLETCYCLFSEDGKPFCLHLYLPQFLQDLKIPVRLEVTKYSTMSSCVSLQNLNDLDTH